ncbi:MAG: acyltransferase family protein [Acidobacteriaceae bacterium]
MLSSVDSRKNNIEFLRLVFAVMVVFAHSFAVTESGAEPFALLTRGQATGGTIAVDAFFILSGFLITASYERSSSAFSFLKKRILRIYPAFLVVTLVTALCVVPLGGGQLEGRGALGKTALVIASIVRLKDIKSLGTFANNPYPHVVNASLWTVSYEFVCYLGVAVLGMTMLLHRRRTIAGLFGASLVVSLLFAQFHWQSGHTLETALFGIPQAWARFIPMYLAGVVFYLYRDRIRLHRWGAILSAIAMAVACVIPLGYTLLFPIFGAYLLMYISYWERLPLYRVMRFGDLSYGTYLYAFPIQQLLMQHFVQHSGVGNSPLRLFAVATPLALTAAAMSWHFIESPSLRAGKRRQRVQNTPRIPFGSSLPISGD